MFQRAIYRQFLFFLTYMAKKVVNRIIHEEGQKVGEWKKEEVWEITQICICFYSHLPMNISDSWATSTFIYIIRVLARKWAAMLSPSPLLCFPDPEVQFLQTLSWLLLVYSIHFHYISYLKWQLLKLSLFFLCNQTNRDLTLFLSGSRRRNQMSFLLRSAGLGRKICLDLPHPWARGAGLK